METQNLKIIWSDQYAPISYCKTDVWQKKEDLISMISIFFCMYVPARVPPLCSLYKALFPVQSTQGLSAKITFVSFLMLIFIQLIWALICLYIYLLGFAITLSFFSSLSNDYPGV